MPTRNSGSSAPAPPTRLFVVAHRAGNSLDRLRDAEARGIELIEADVRLGRDRCEVRHRKTLGPLPVLWDRWEIASGLGRRLLLAELLEAAAPATELVLDLKGRRPRLAELVREALEPHLGRRPLIVCARARRLLEPFEGLPVRRVHSVGSARQLRALLRRGRGSGLDGIAVHERLLDRHVAAELRRIADVVLAWPVNARARARELAELGVHGLISDDAAALSTAVVGRAAA